MDFALKRDIRKTRSADFLGQSKYYSSCVTPSTERSVLAYVSPR